MSRSRIEPEGAAMASAEEDLRRAIEMKENLRKSVALMGFPPETDMQVLFSSMN